MKIAHENFGITLENPTKTDLADKIVESDLKLMNHNDNSNLNTNSSISATVSNKARQNILVKSSST